MSEGKDVSTLGIIQIAPYVPANPEELARRDRAVKDLLAFREAVGPVDLSLEDLLADEEDDEP